MMKPSPEYRIREAWNQISSWVSHHRLITRIVISAASLVIFLVVILPSIRNALWANFQSNKILAGMLFVFSILAISLIWSTGQRLDSWIFLLFNVRGSRPLWLDRIMLGFTQIGSGITAIGVALILFLVGDRLFAYQLMLGTLSLWLMVELVKFVVSRSRPFIGLTQARIVGYRAIGRSFPSGHTSEAFFMTTLILQHFHANVWVVLLLYTVAFLVGITRMYVGAHYPRDVLAGAILGSAWGLLGAIFEGYALLKIG